MEPCRIIVLAGMLGCALLVAAPSSHAATTYTDLSSFEAALGEPSVLVDDYNDLPGAAYTPFPVQRDGYVIDLVQSGIGIFSGSGAQNIDGTTHLILGGNGALTFTFDSAIMALAFEYRASDTTPQVMDISATDFNAQLVAQTNVQFFGVIFEQPVSEIAFTRAGGFSNFGIDNIRAQSFGGGSLPEPTSAMLCALGLVAMVARPRRQCGTIRA